MSTLKMKTTVKASRILVLALLIIPLLFLVILLKAAGAGQVYGTDGELKTHHVDVFKVEVQKSYERQLHAVGKIESTQRATMGFERAGTVIRALVDDGQKVAAGDLLAELDTQRLEAQKLEAEATVARAKADARLADISAKRIAKLVKDKVESMQRLDEAREQAAAAQAFVTQVEASLQRISIELEKSKIYAPYSGTIISRFVDPGSVVATGQTVFTMQQDDAAEARFAMGADLAFTLNIGDVYELQLPSLSNNSLSRASVKGTVKSISNARNVNTRTVDVIFTLAPGAKVLSGDLLTLVLPQTINEIGSWLPKTALASGVRGLWTVYTVNAIGSDQKVVPKTVTVLYHTPEHVYVSGAINKGDFVIVEGVHRLVPGQVVNASVSQILQLVNR